MDNTLNDACNLLSAWSNAKRSPRFFLAWFTEEKGHVPWDAVTNNPFNVSGPIAPSEPWAYGITHQEPNGVVAYENWQIGVLANWLVIQQVFPQVLEADSDEAACLSLNQPGKFGGRWAANIQYGEELWAIYQELAGSNTPSGDDATPSPSLGEVSGSGTVPTPIRKYVVQRGDSVNAIAAREGVSAEQIMSLNRLKPPYLIYPGEELRLS